MRNINEDTITQAVLAAMSGCPEHRLCTVMPCRWFSPSRSSLVGAEAVGGNRAYLALTNGVPTETLVPSIKERRDRAVFGLFTAADVSV